jgi:peptidoglycan hydrolase-like protein with peptidoglycan-binding domain
LCVLSSFHLTACSEERAVRRAREAAEEIQKSIPDVDAVALSQQVDPTLVKEVQTHLTALKEYQGEISGKLDSVTINAIQAFQRSEGLRDDGLLDEKTLERLRTSAAKRQAAEGEARQRPASSV